VLPQFSQTYEYCQGSEPYSKSGQGTTYDNGCCNQASNTIVSCAECNNSAGYSTFLDRCHSLIDNQNNTHCYQCSSFGARTNRRGIVVLFLIIGVLALMFKLGIIKA
jgi:hypothetical protein